LWGGEVLRVDFNGYKRVGHLQQVPLLGGEMAVRDPRRLVFAISELVGAETHYFDENKAKVLRKMIPKSPMTSSFGRVLDALACYLDICRIRTYDGEPAMKLERHMEIDRWSGKFNLERKGDTIMTLPLFEQLFETKGKDADIIYSCVRTILLGLVDIACEEAERERIKRIGLTGGVSYNHTISNITRELVKSRGFEFVCHDGVPNGDGGISVGQCAIALNSFHK
jgi:hydrogenase maturation protein HypF